MQYVVSQKLGTIYRYSDKALDFNPNVSLEEDDLFIKLLNYLVSESFLYHNAWAQEFEYIFKTKERPFDFKKLPVKLP